MRQFAPQVRSLTLFMFLVWCLVTPVAWLVSGFEGAAGSTISSVVTLLFGSLAILIFGYLGEPNRVAAVMVATNLRLFGTLGAVLLFRSLHPAWGLSQFYIWLIVNYLAGLSWETRIFWTGGPVDLGWMFRPQSK
ncbi:MAG: hypothetical protein KDA68_19660 [Planctomycetaceae bacterium]|nr:hypothetical protein [Planctomycetaceae bacterium]